MSCLWLWHDQCQHIMQLAALMAQVQELQKEKEILKMNLDTAEAEVYQKHSCPWDSCVFTWLVSYWWQANQLFSWLLFLKVVTLSEDNRALDEEIKRLLGLLEKERQCRSERKKSASTSTKVNWQILSRAKRKQSVMGWCDEWFLLQNKRKSSSLRDGSPAGRALDFGCADSSRHPLSPLPHNSPDYRAHKKWRQQPTNQPTVQSISGLTCAQRECCIVPLMIWSKSGPR